MCKAIEDLINDSKAEGRLEGRLEGKIDLMSGMVRDNIITIKDAAARLDMTEEAFSAILRK